MFDTSCLSLPSTELLFWASPSGFVCPTPLRARSSPYDSSFSWTLAALLGIAAALYSDFRDGLLRGVAAAGVFSAALVVLGLASDSSHIESGRAIAAAIAVMPFVSILRQHSSALRLATTAFLCVAAFSTGARGPLTFALFSIVLVLALSRSASALEARERTRWRLLVVAAVCVFSFAISTDRIDLERLEGGASRQAELLQARSIRDVQSLEVRLDELYAPAIETIENRPWGTGLPADVSEASGYQYPHNLVLELGVAFGWFGVIGATAALIATARGIRWSMGTSPAIGALIIYLVLNAQVSDDLIGNRMIFFAIAFGLVVRPKYLTSRFDIF